jgi:hypothetical protein
MGDRVVGNRQGPEPGGVGLIFDTGRNGDYSGVQLVAVLVSILPSPEPRIHSAMDLMEQTADCSL